MRQRSGADGYAGDGDSDTLVTDPLLPGADAYDCDGDGYSGSTEAHVTTSDQNPTIEPLMRFVEA